MTRIDPDVIPAGDPRLNDPIWQWQNADRLARHAAARLRASGDVETQLDKSAADVGAMRDGDPRLDDASWQATHQGAMIAHAERRLAEIKADHEKAGLAAEIARD